MRRSLFALAASISFFVAAGSAHAQDARLAAAPRTPTPVIVPQVREPQLAPLALGLDYLMLLRADHASTAFGPSSSSALQITASLIVWEPARNFSVAPELTWRHEDRNSMLMQAAQASLAIDVVSAGAIVRWEPLRWLAPFVRGSVGVEHHSAVVGTLTGDGIAVAGTVGGGLELDLPLGAGLLHRRAPADAALALFVEGGVILGTPSVVRVTARANPGELPADAIPRTSVRLGSMDATAGYFRVGLAVRF